MSELRFVVKPGLPFAGSPIYSRSEHSFGFEPAPRDPLCELTSEAGVTSVVVETLQIEVNVHDGRALHVWGYHPELKWYAQSLSPPAPHAGAIFVAKKKEFVSGVSIGLAEIGEWSTGFDEATGWVRATAALDSDDEQVVLIATDTCLGLIGDQLNSIWVRPTFEQ